MDCEILDERGGIGGNGEATSTAAVMNLIGMRQAAVLGPARPLLTRDPKSYSDELGGQRPPGNSRQGDRQITELAVDQVHRCLRRTPQLQRFRAPSEGAARENTTHAPVCLFGSQAQAEMVSKQLANEMRPSRSKKLARSSFAPR